MSINTAQQTPMFGSCRPPAQRARPSTDKSRTIASAARGRIGSGAARARQSTVVLVGRSDVDVFVRDAEGGCLCPPDCPDVRAGTRPAPTPSSHPGRHPPSLRPQLRWANKAGRYGLLTTMAATACGRREGSSRVPRSRTMRLQSSSTSAVTRLTRSGRRPNASAQSGRA